MKWNESGFRPPLCTYRLNWAKRTSWGWWDVWDDTVLQTQDSKFEPWRSEAEHATSRSRRLPTILTFTRGWGRNIFYFFETAETGNRTPNSGVKGRGANHYPRAPALSCNSQGLISDWIFITRWRMLTEANCYTANTRRLSEVGSILAHCRFDIKPRLGERLVLNGIYIYKQEILIIINRKKNNSETSETCTCLEEEFSNEISLKRRFPFFHYFNGIYVKVDKKLQQTEIISLSNENCFPVPDSLKGILNIMYLYPMRSRLLLTDSLTRDTNSQAELWMRILKKI